MVGSVGTGMVDGWLCWDRYGRWLALFGQVWKMVGSVCL